MSSSPAIWSHQETISYVKQIFAIYLSDYEEALSWRDAFYLINIQTTDSSFDKMCTDIPKKLCLQYVDSTTIATNSFHCISLFVEFDATVWSTWKDSLSL